MHRLIETNYQYIAGGSVDVYWGSRNMDQNVILQGSRSDNIHSFTKIIRRSQKDKDVITNFVNYLPSEQDYKSFFLKTNKQPMALNDDACKNAQIYDNYNCLSDLHKFFENQVSLNPNNAITILKEITNSSFNSSYYRLEPDVIKYMKTSKVSPLKHATSRKLSPLVLDNKKYFKSILNTHHNHYPKIDEIQKHTSYKNHTLYAASDAFFSTRNYIKKINLRSGDAIDKIYEIINAAFNNLVSFHISKHSLNSIMSPNTPIIPQHNKIQSSGLNYLNPLIIVPYKMVKGSNSLFIPKQRNPCPYFGVVIGVYHLDNFGDSPYNSPNDNFHFAPRLLLNGEVCAQNSNKPIQSSQYTEYDIYHQNSPLIKDIKSLSIVNLESYIKLDSAFNRLSTKYTGVHELSHSLNIPFIVHPSDDIFLYTDQDNNNSSKFISTNTSKLNLPTHNIYPPSINYDSLLLPQDKMYTISSSSPRVTESLRSWKHGRNYTYDGFYNRRTHRFNNRYINIIPTSENENHINNIVEKYNKFIKDMIKIVGYKKPRLDNNLSQCILLNKQNTAHMSRIIVNS